MKKLMLFALMAGCAALPGCIPGKTYRSASPTETVPKLPVFGERFNQIPAGNSCAPRDAGDFSTPCMAYIEFDDFGEFRVAPGDARGAGQIGERTTQLSAALSLINVGMTPRPGERSQPIVMVFVHGWKHNASDGKLEDPNVQGQKGFLDLLKDRYPDQWVESSSSNRCQSETHTGCILLRHPIIGIYIAWRGDVISHYFPVTRQFTYFNREATAYRVGGESLTFALAQISKTAHPSSPTATHPKQDEPFLLMMGHSFGGLILEKALQQALTERLLDGERRNTTFADLIVFVNTAMAASDSKQMIDLLAIREGRHGTLNARDSENGKRYPMIVSLSSATDQATLSAIFFGHGLSALTRKMTAGDRSPDPLYCYEPETGKSGVISSFSQNDFYMHTAPHFEALQSHEVIGIPGSQCKTLNQLNSHLGAERVSDSFGPTESMDGTCYYVLPKNSKSTTELGEPSGPRCNGTPYFVMEVPHEIIPDHGTIFTLRHWQLLTLFLNTTSEDATNPTDKQRGLIRLTAQ